MMMGDETTERFDAMFFIPMEQFESITNQFEAELYEKANSLLNILVMLSESVVVVKLRGNLQNSSSNLTLCDINKLLRSPAKITVISITDFDTSA